MRVFCSGTAAPVTGDYIISAIPLSTFRMVDVAPALSPEKARVVAELPYTSVTRLFLQFDQRFWLDSGLEGLASTDLPVSDNAPIPGFWIEEATSPSCPERPASSTATSPGSGHASSRR